jgi:hypothetical protein
MRPRVEAALALIFAILFTANSVRAAVVIVKGSGQPIMGYVVRQDERSVTLREMLPGGKSRESSFPRTSIDELIVTVSPERLASLDPARLTDYFEYAEELAEKQRDPEARETAIRLYCIVAASGDGSLRRSALLGLIALARSTAEERKLRAAAYILGEEHDESLLKRESGAISTPQSTAFVADLLAALRLIRQGKLSQSRAILEKPALRNEASQLAAIVTMDELAELSSSSQLSNLQLARVLRAELALEELKLGRNTGDGSLSDDGQHWSSALQPGGLAPLPLLSTQSLTEFDPSECVYRNGKWTRP